MDSCCAAGSWKPRYVLVSQCALQTCKKSLVRNPPVFFEHRPKHLNHQDGLHTPISTPTTNIPTDSAKAAAKIMAKDMMSFYKGNEPGQIPGTLLKPYYWWQAGAMWGELVEYWAMTGDTQYNSLVSNSLLFQVGDDRNYMPANASKEEGNDDQV
jgi:hypothetical protein